MKNRAKSMRGCIEEIRRGLQEAQRDSQLVMIKELEIRLEMLRKKAVTYGEMEKAAELSVCEAMATVIKHIVEGGEKNGKFEN